MKININPKNKLFRWGPIDGRPIYPDYWYGGFDAFNKKYKPGWPAVISYFNKEKMFVVTDFVCLYKNGEEVFKIDFVDLHYYTIRELENIFLGKELPQAEIKRRKQYFLALYESQKGISYYSGSVAKKFFSPYANVKIKKDIKEFKGLVVNRGLARGIVKIIRSPKEAGKLKKGEILVAAMTSPDYILALKKASAVITDEGGMTCHAAIVSRELKIPCIVAAKIATKVLKDGDLVEVDAENGVVKILK